MPRFETEEKKIVDTLFGEQIETTSNEDAYQEELPDILFSQPSGEQQRTLELVNVPYYAPRIVIPQQLRDLIPYVDELSLYETRWGYDRDKDESYDNWCVRVMPEASEVLNSIKGLCEREKIVSPQAVFSYVQAKANGSQIDFYDEEGKSVLCSATFQRREDGFCLTDALESDEFSPVAVIAVNMGKVASDTAKQWLLMGRDNDFRFLDGFVRETVKALAEYVAALVNREGRCVGDSVFLGMARDCDSRIQQPLLDVLEASRIGITFNRNFLMGPEYSALALVLPR